MALQVVLANRRKLMVSGDEPTSFAVVAAAVEAVVVELKDRKRNFVIMNLFYYIQTKITLSINYKKYSEGKSVWQVLSRPQDI